MARKIKPDPGVDHGTGFGPAVVIEDVAVSPTAITRRARRADPLDAIDMTPGQRQAARIYRQAYEHADAGRGMGPLPYGRDSAFSSTGGVWLAPQERALSAADWLRRGYQAIGLAASQGVVHWVVIVGHPLHEYDGIRKWRRGTASAQLKSALERLSEEYGTA